MKEPEMRRQALEETYYHGGGKEGVCLMKPELEVQRLM